MKLIAITLVFLFLTIDALQGQSYKDIFVRRGLRSEVKVTKAMRRKADDQVAPVAQISAVAIVENYGSKLIAAKPPTPRLLLCTNFLFPFSLKARKCKAKVKYLSQAANTAFGITNAYSGKKIPHALRMQILEKYTTIINQIEFEYELMEVEKQKRKKFNLFRS